MARLEYIDFKPWREAVRGSVVTWERDKLAREFNLLPQIFWGNGEDWAEANHWSLVKLAEERADQATVKALMKHLHAYASFLEEKGLDWRQFPIRVSERAIVQFRGALKRQIDDGSLASSTARSRMNAVIQFYRHAEAHDFVEPDTPMWRERSVVMPFYDAAGFKRTMTRVGTDLSIPNRKRPGVRLEDGLLPLSEEHMVRLLQYTEKHESRELHLLLTTGFFVGARLETITTLRIENLEQAYPDPTTRGFHLLRVGPGTGVATKFDVEGALLVPDFLLVALKKHAYSTSRLKREALANNGDQSLVFLTVRGRQYSGNSVSRLMTDLRRNCARAGLSFMLKFKFHETRATYGTWLMKLALSVTTVGAAIEFVKNAMFHKYESTTFRYVKFLENNRGKQEAAEAFSRAFTGLNSRSWDDFDA